MTTSISNTLFKFANSFDMKDWQGLKSTLTDSVDCEYQDFRGKSEACSSESFVAARKEALLLTS